MVKQGDTLSLLSISGRAFSTAFFWMKAQASSTLSRATMVPVVSMVSLCAGVRFLPRVAMNSSSFFFIDTCE